MRDVAEVLADARQAHAERVWQRAFELFSHASATRALSPEDWQALSDAAWWLGRIDDFLEAGESAFRGLLEDGRHQDAAMTALEIAVSLSLRGDDSRASGWVARAQRLLDDLPEGPVHGYVRYVLEVEGGLGGEDLEAVVAAARDVQRIGRLHGDSNLVAGGVLAEGRALVKLGDVSRGLRQLDEAMVAVLHEDLVAEWAGNLYCHLMAACHELADIRRAREWTQATSAWLSEQSAAVLFTGICRVHRSQVLLVTGEWERAEAEAKQVVEDLSDIHVESVAEAHYQMGELRRLRGELAGAEDDFRRARRMGRDPQPGMALLRLAQGRTDDARVGIRAALHAVSNDRLARVRLCGAQVEIALTAADLNTARRACAELEDAAANYMTSGLEAAALHWRGAVAVEEERPAEALPALRAACQRWHELHAAYDAARSCVLLGRAYLALGDRDAAVAELTSARDTFDRLGAAIDARAVSQLTGQRLLPGGLTRREAEVLGLIASGKTNREVADELVLSEKTIARHLSNVFSKLDVSTRTEAAAFAFEHGLAGTGHG